MASPIVAGVRAGMSPRDSAGSPSSASPQQVTKRLPKLMAGAQACIAMLAKIDEQARATVEPTSDAVGEVQAPYAGQYAAIDAAIASALDEHGDSEGFRRALAHYLLNIAQGNIPDPNRMQASALLADDGYRAMPTDDASGDAADDLDFEDAGFRLSRLLDLAGWVEQARDVLCDIRLSCEIDPQLEAVLRRNRVPFNSPSWDREQSEGLGVLLGDARCAVKRITEAAREGRSHG